MSNFVYIDNSNVFIEGKRVSAVRKGLVSNIYDAMNRKSDDLAPGTLNSILKQSGLK